MTELDRLFYDLKVDDPIAGRMILIDAYDKLYGICNHELDPSPLSHVTLPPISDVHTYSNLYGKFWRFAESGISKLFNISFDKYMELPREYTTLMYEISVTLASKKAPSKELEDLEKQLKEAGM